MISRLGAMSPHRSRASRLPVMLGIDRRITRSRRNREEKSVAFSFGVSGFLWLAL